MVQNDSTMSTPSHDLVAFGATSFVGKILCRYLEEEFGTQGPIKWAAAGRSKAKLEHLRSSLGAKAGALPLVVADAADEASLRKSSCRRSARTRSMASLWSRPAPNPGPTTATSAARCSGSAA